MTSNRLTLTPVTLREACAFVAQVHRHHRPPQGGKFAVGCSVGDAIVGVAIVGHPLARMLDDGYTAELTRCATDGTRNACSFLYRAAWRVAAAMGYLKMITYTLQEEGGSSLRGAGFKLIGKAGGGAWARKTRPAVDSHPLQEKLRWEIAE